MKVQTQPHGKTTVLVAHGPLVSDELDGLRNAIDALAAGAGEGPPGSHDRVVVDLSDVPYLDSSGLELLLEIAAVTPPADAPWGVRGKLAAVSETCLEAMELTGVLQRVHVFDTVENAVRSYREAGA